MRNSLMMALLALLPVLVACSRQDAGHVAAVKPSAGQVVFRGGYETNPVDHGRPVGLIANALGVAPEVFRDAFSGVNPAKGGSPSASRVSANKQVLMEKLNPHGVTNERLDEVSNFYRYRPQAGELWSHKPASATATISEGKVTAITIVDGGYGYSTPPEVEIAGYEDVRIEAELEFTTDLKTNGRVKALTILE
ncbi:MAG: hypothetical protein KDA58_09910 [Planctomycetaceae bacterium]|nr:hypothetical protein [Planctomycetaceae bacterium]